MKLLGCSCLVITLGTLAPVVESSADDLNDIRAIFELPEAELLEPDELQEIIDRWDDALLTDQRAINRLFGRLTTPAEEGPLEGISVLRYGNAELIDRIVESVLDYAYYSSDCEEQEQAVIDAYPPGWFNVGSGEYDLALHRLGLSTFDERLAPAVLYWESEELDSSSALRGPLRAPYIAVTAPERFLDTVFLDSTLGERPALPEENANPNVFYADNGEPIMALEEVLAVLSWIPRTAPDTAEAYRGHILGFVESYALYYTVPRPQATAVSAPRYLPGRDFDTRTNALRVLDSLGGSEHREIAAAIRDAPMPVPAATERLQERREGRLDEIRQVADETLAKLDAR